MNDFCPDFFLLGAPKCGTTTVAQWLKEQDSLFLPSVKEPNFFNFDEKMYASHTEKQYFDLYKSAKQNQLLGDATPWYLASEYAFDEILKRNPNAKYIVLIRDHIDLACAMHQQEYVSGNEDCEDFYTAWNLQDDRLRGLRIPEKCYSEKRLQYLKACSIGQQLKKIVNKIDENNILVVHMEAIQKSPIDVKEAIATLLCFNVVDNSEFPVVNSRKQWNSPIWLAVSRFVVRIKKLLRLNFSFGLVTKIGQKKIARTKLDQTIKKELSDQFLEDKLLLDKILNINLKSRYIR